MSTDELPEPPVPADADLTMFNYMPLHIDRLLQSSLFVKASPEAFRAAIALMCVAWHRVPAGSLPDDDQRLAAMAGLGTSKTSVTAWRRLRRDALRGWYSADDGNLYHPLLAEVVNTSLNVKRSKAKQRLQGNERQRRHAERLRPTTVADRSDTQCGEEGRAVKHHDASADASGPSPMTRQLTSQKGFELEEVRGGIGSDERHEAIAASVRDDVPRSQKAAEYTPEFEEFFQTYPKGVGKLECFPLYSQAVAHLGANGVAILLDGARRYRARCITTGTPDRFIKAPKTWLLGRCWEEISMTLRPQERPGGQFGVGG
ncbi:MAG: DUF1376 domain-containing protein [Verrucomicrobiaceae bacterium]|nr:MAG: DUF1376 domain-containing protein [Verrucomicrobiaceae bacterium]